MRLMRPVLVLAALLATLVAPATADRSRSVRQRLVGTWRLVDFVERDAAGVVVARPFGVHPAGRLTYAADGAMWATGGHGGGPGTDRAGFWYTGAFTVDTRRHEVRHVVRYSTFSAWEGTTLVRGYRFSGARRLTLSAAVPGAPGHHLILVWAR